MEDVPENLRNSRLWNQWWRNWRYGDNSTENRIAFVKHLLRDHESRNITYMDPDGSWPIIWRKAQGLHIWDEAGRKYLDLTAAFGVAAMGHGNRQVVKAGTEQMRVMLHAMGDVHPHALKALLARKLSDLTFCQWWYNYKKTVEKDLTPDWFETGKTIFCNSGFEAVEAALKTAFLATQKRGVIAFEGAYHGLGYGAVTATHRSHFRSPFREQLADFCHFVPFPTKERQLKSVEQKIRSLFRRKQIGSILTEPIQARAGIRIPVDGFLPMLRAVAEENGAILIYDEIFTGFGRTGSWFAWEEQIAPPDIVCLGKALTGGFPLSACVGRASIMDKAWPPTTGEAIHTSTYLGHPVGCAMALAQIEQLEGGLKRTREPIYDACQLGHYLLKRLNTIKPPPGYELEARGRGLLAGLEIRYANGSPATNLALGVIKLMLQRGYILLPEGEHANVISFSPPLTITRRHLANTVSALKKALADCAKRIA